MPRPLSHLWAAAVFRFRWLVIIGWIGIAALLYGVAPSWQQVALDGDFEYLPRSLSSVAGGDLLDRAFPGERSRSQIVLIVSRNPLYADKLLKTDVTVELDLLRRIYHRLGEVAWQRAIALGYEGGPNEKGQPWFDRIELAKQAFDASIAADEEFYERISEDLSDAEPTLTEPRMAIAFWDRGKLLESIGGDEAAIERDFEAALILKSDIPKLTEPIEKRPLKAWQSLLDVLSWQDPAIGSRLKKNGARLAVLQLSSEFAATENIATVEVVEQLLEQVSRYSGRHTDPGLRLDLTGSAAIGGETLIAARDAIRYTELITVVMILVLLWLVYRAPLLVLVPMISIAVAVAVSMSLVALLCGLSMQGGLPGISLRIFTTSRIFVFVILFGAGTDYCLFLISRWREEATSRSWDEASQRALSGVMSALIGSAMTTVVGLGMLWIASFGKFHYTGPIIAICLLVGLLVCTSLTPAILRVLGPVAFWPMKMGTAASELAPDATLLPSNGPASPNSGLASPSNGPAGSRIWGLVALQITRRPAFSLLVGFLLLAFPAVYGLYQESSVTYDLSSQLSRAAKSREGLRSLSEHFSIGEINPVTVLIEHDHDVPRKEFEEQIKRLVRKLYDQDGVAAVRTIDDPLGDFPPDQEMGLFSSAAWKRRALRNHRVAQQYFFSTLPEYQHRLARLDVVMRGDPFSIETAKTVSDLGRFLVEQTKRTGDVSSSATNLDLAPALSTEEVSQSAPAVLPADPDFLGANVLLTGTTPSIIDLRSVTLRDNRRIKLAVVIAVFIVLWLVIRRLVLCSYLIFTVLVSYYATLGLTVLFFRYAYGDDFVGLDWKLPLFLFVILVAIGQDYNVYLVTRVLEEEQRLGWVSALRRAVSRTGGIITACGLVMAATFLSMTASAWLPWLGQTLGLAPPTKNIALRGIVELGFALGLGVLIDTFYVRTVLVPSFIAAAGKWRARRS